MHNVIKIVSLRTSDRCHWCGNLLLFWGFPRQCAHWLGMTYYLILMTLPTMGAREAKMCSLNRIGRQAADFRFADRKGRMRNLYDIEAETILLFFSNPGCEACMNIINMLNGTPQVAELIAAGRLAVLNIYIDEDIQAWRSYMPIYPETWYNGFDPDLVLRGNDVYCVRAIPSLYVLDAQKKVILKDAPEQKVLDLLMSL